MPPRDDTFARLGGRVGQRPGSATVPQAAGSGGELRRRRGYVEVPAGLHRNARQRERGDQQGEQMWPPRGRRVAGEGTRPGTALYRWGQGETRASRGPSPLSDGMTSTSAWIRVREVASMGPSPLSDGMRDRPRPPSRRPGGFNGAVASQRRNAGNGIRRKSNYGCFNGAVASQRRNAVTSAWGAALRSHTLQWGRRLSATE